MGSYWNDQIFISSSNFLDRIVGGLYFWIVNWPKMARDKSRDICAIMTMTIMVTILWFRSWSPGRASWLDIYCLGRFWHFNHRVYSKVLSVQCATPVHNLQCEECMLQMCIVSPCVLHLLVQCSVPFYYTMCSLWGRVSRVEWLYADTSRMKNPPR